MKRIEIFITTGILIMLVVIGALIWTQKLFYNENQEYYSDLKALREYSQKLRSEQGQLMQQNRVLQFSTSELKDLYPELVREIKNMKIQPNKVLNISSSPFLLEKNIQTTLVDSILYDTLKVKVFNFQDAYLKLSGIQHGNQQHINAQYRDTLVQVVFRGEREKPYLWIFSKRKLQQRLYLKSPYAQIEYPTYIQISK